MSQVFDETDAAILRGHIAIGHARYSTTGGSTWENAQPTFQATTADGSIALGHNGNLVNTAELAGRRECPPSDGRAPPQLGDHQRHRPGHHAARRPTRTSRSRPRALEVLPTLRGAFSFVFMDENTLYAARDPQGVRPLVLGRLERGWVVASETAALDIVGASYVREVEPGELIAIDEDGLRSPAVRRARPQGLRLRVRLPRPPGHHDRRPQRLRRPGGDGPQLAKEHPVEADLVIPVPESGTPAAIGYAEACGIPYGPGLVKNAYVGRTFIQPSQTIRQLGIRLKLNPLREIVRGKRLVVVDDSIVRGNTQRALVRMLREAGAVEVHVRISSPPVKWPCFYGIDFATRAELIANGLDIDGIRRSIGADTLGYVSARRAWSRRPSSRRPPLRACFDGEYPIELPADLEQHVLGTQRRSSSWRTRRPAAVAAPTGARGS